MKNFVITYTRYVNTVLVLILKCIFYTYNNILYFSIFKCLLYFNCYIITLCYCCINTISCQFLYYI